MTPQQEVMLGKAMFLASVRDKSTPKPEFATVASEVEERRLDILRMLAAGNVKRETLAENTGLTRNQMDTDLRNLKRRKLIAKAPTEANRAIYAITAAGRAHLEANE